LPVIKRFASAWPVVGGANLLIGSGRGGGGREGGIEGAGAAALGHHVSDPSLHLSTDPDHLAVTDHAVSSPEGARRGIPGM
jgi:hypothetical protein